MKVCTTGLTVRFLSVTIATGHVGELNSTGSTLIGNRAALNRSVDPDSAEMKRLVVNSPMRW
jgi:hypothetical protein